jgi:hypothetical protein
MENSVDYSANGSEAYAHDRALEFLHQRLDTGMYFEVCLPNEEATS